MPAVIPMSFLRRPTARCRIFMVSLKKRQDRESSHRRGDVKKRSPPCNGRIAPGFACLSCNAPAGGNPRPKLGYRAGASRRPGVGGPGETGAKHGILEDTFCQAAGRVKLIFSALRTVMEQGVRPGFPGEFFGTPIPKPDTPWPWRYAREDFFVLTNLGNVAA